MKATLIGDVKIDPSVLDKLRAQAKPESLWAVYENHDLGSRDIGHIQFLRVGVGNTYEEAPGALPVAGGWRYLHVGYVNLESGCIE